MRFLKKISEWTMLLVMGFIVGLFFGPQIIDEILPPDEFQQTNIADQQIETEQTSQNQSRLADLLSPYPDSVDEGYIENRVFDLVNDLRSSLQLGPVEKNETLREAANIRAVEIEKSFSHTRPNGQDPFSVFEELDTKYYYQMVGENLAMATFIGDEESMSELVMEGWIESKDHYQTMINPDYNEIGIGVHYDGEILYVTQFFGIQR